MVSIALDCKNLIGESCFWDSKENCLIWTDIEGKTIWKLDESNQSFKFNLPDRAGFILPRKKDGFIIGFPKFIAISNQNFSSFEKICDVEVSVKKTRINDAKVDPYGGIVFGTYNEDPDKLTEEECIKRFSLSAKNPRYVTSLNEWTYSAAVGPYGGYAMKQRDRTVFENSELAEMKKDEIRELIENEKSRKISNFLGGEILKLPKSASKESMIDKISKHFELNEKDIKTLSKENLVELAKSLEIVFYRGRFRMKPEDATKDNLINKILFEKKNKPLESPRKALTVSPSEVLELFGDTESS